MHVAKIWTIAATFCVMCLIQQKCSQYKVIIGGDYRLCAFINVLIDLVCHVNHITMFVSDPNVSNILLLLIIVLLQSESLPYLLIITFIAVSEVQDPR